MSAEGVCVKKEPVDLSENEENGQEENIPESAIGPEFINIKMEIEPISPRTSTDTEETNNAPSSPGAKKTDSWDETITKEKIMPEDSIQIVVKIEPDDYDYENVEEPSSTNASDGQGTTEESNTSLSCNICFKTFANSSNKQRHMLTHNKKRFSCPECPKQFLHQEQLDKHAHRHALKQIERAYICDVCDKSFKSSSNLRQHKRVHLEVKPYFCPQCHRTFAFKANLTKHQGKSRCTRPIGEPITCHICNKVFHKEFLLKSHLRRHETFKPFECDQCDMTFKYKSTLIRHVQLHMGIRPFACNYCGKTFTHSGLLKPHLRKHTGEKPFPCPICDKNFAHKHNMQRHAMSHNKVKHLVCEVCHKKFPKESRLKYHMKTHVNEKYFACAICPKRFSHKQNAMRHYSRKHPEATYDCPETDASVATKVWDSFKDKYNNTAEEILG